MSSGSTGGIITPSFTSVISANCRLAQIVAYVISQECVRRARAAKLADAPAEAKTWQDHVTASVCAHPVWEFISHMLQIELRGVWVCQRCFHVVFVCVASLFMS